MAVLIAALTRCSGHLRFQISPLKEVGYKGAAVHAAEGSVSHGSVFLESGCFGSVTQFSGSEERSAIAGIRALNLAKFDINGWRASSPTVADSTGLPFRSASLPSEQTERDLNSPIASIPMTYFIPKREYCYEEGSFRGGVW